MDEGFEQSKAPEISPAHRKLLDINNRITILEQKVDSVRDHVQLVDNGVIDKHKAVLTQVKQLSNDIADLKLEVEETHKFVDRINQRLSAFASKEQVDVLEKYINFWQPLNFVTEDGVRKMIEDVLPKSSKRGEK